MAAVKRARLLPLLLVARATLGLVSYEGDVNDTIFDAPNCLPMATTLLNFSEGFHLHNNLGGVGPELARGDAPWGLQRRVWS